MKILVEAGHGKNYRQQGEYDFGLFADDGSHEAAITGAYASRLQLVLRAHGHSSLSVREGSIVHRMRWAFMRERRIILSLHMGHDLDALPGGRVLWATDGSKAIADAVAPALGFPVVQTEQETGLLRFNPSIEIELGNIASWQDMKRLRCASHCSDICNRIASALTELLQEATSSEPSS